MVFSSPSLLQAARARGSVSWVPLGRILVLLLLVTISAAPIGAQRGAVTVPQNLGQLVDEAAVIVRGHVVSARFEPHPQLQGLATVVVTLQVQETLKGSVGSTYTFRQFIWDVRDRYDLAGYRKGQQLLLLMTKPSSYGLSSPVGLEQGRFRILTDAAGNQVAVNGRANAGLFRDLAPVLRSKGARLSPRQAALVTAPAPGPAPLDELRDLIRQLAGSK